MGIISENIMHRVEEFGMDLPEQGDKMAITEDMHLEKEWFAEAGKQTMSTLPHFVNHLMNDYMHDYGTRVHAISACALAAAYAANNSENGGITGFQAGFVMWDFIRQWQYPYNDCGMRIMNYDDMLYPQYAYKFQKTITRDTWNELQVAAKKQLEATDYAAKSVILHWQSIVDGKVPFGYRVAD